MCLIQMPQTPDTSAILLRAARTPEHAQLLLNTVGLWIGSNGLTDAFTLRIAHLVLQSSDTSQMNEAARVKLCCFLDRCLTMTPTPVSAVYSIISRIDKTQSLLNYCETSGFTKRLVAASETESASTPRIDFTKLLGAAPVFEEVRQL